MKIAIPNGLKQRFTTESPLILSNCCNGTVKLSEYFPWQCGNHRGEMCRNKPLACPTVYIWNIRMGNNGINMWDAGGTQSRDSPFALFNMWHSELWEQMRKHFFIPVTRRLYPKCSSISSILTLEKTTTSSQTVSSLSAPSVPHLSHPFFSWDPPTRCFWRLSWAPWRDPLINCGAWAVHCCLAFPTLIPECRYICR